MKYFLSVLGMVLIIEGLPYFVFPDKLKAYMKKLIEVNDSLLRIVGLIAMLAGLLLLYLGTI